MNPFKKHACAFKNEAECEEELESEAGITLEEAESSYFEDQIFYPKYRNLPGLGS